MRMKRWISALLAVIILCTSLDISAFAAPDTTVQTEDSVTEDNILKNNDSELEENAMDGIEEKRATQNEDDVINNLLQNSESQNTWMPVSPGGSLGRAMLNTVPLEVDTMSQGVNSGIREIIVDTNMARVVYYAEAAEDHILVVGIYDETGKKQLATGKLNVSKGQKEVVVTLDNTVPEYFVIKSFLIEPETFRPLGKAYQSDDYTQVMQEFYALSTADFDANKVVQFDENDDTNNFMVFNEDVFVIEEDKEGTTNKVIECDETNHRYKIQNPDDSIKNLGDGVTIIYLGESVTFLTKVTELIWNEEQTEVEIQGEEKKTDELFRFIKIGARNPKDQISEVSLLAEEEEIPTVLKFSVGVEGVILKFGEEEGTSGETAIPWDKFLSDFDKGVYDDVIAENKEDFRKKLEGLRDGGLEDETEIEFELKVKASLEDFKIEFFTDWAIGKASAAVCYQTEISGTVGYSLTVTLPKFYVTIPVLAAVPKKLLVAGMFLYGELGFEGEVKFTYKETGSMLVGVRRYLYLPRIVVPYVDKTNPDSSVTVDANVNFSAKLVVEVTAQLLGLDNSNSPDIEESNKWIDFFTKFQLVGITIKGELGAELGIEMTMGQDSTVLHKCLNCPETGVPFCTEFILRPLINVGAEVGVLFIEGSINIDMDEKLKLPGFTAYYTAAFDEFGEGECPYKEAYVNGDNNIHIEDRNNQNVSGATIYSAHGTYQTNQNGYATVPFDVGKQNIYIEYRGVIHSKEINIPQDMKYGKLELELDLLLNETSQPMADSTIVEEIYMTRDGSVSYIYEPGICYAALTKDGSLYTWGSNGSGQLGIGSSEEIEVLPTKIPGNKNELTMPVKILSEVSSFQYSPNGNMCAAITKDGSLYLWGKNSHGQMAKGEVGGYVNKPSKVMENVDKFYFSPTEQNCAAIKKDGSLYMWGDELHGFIYVNEEIGDITIPAPMLMGKKIKEVRFEEERCFALTVDNELYAWGRNYYGETGTQPQQNTNYLAIGYDVDINNPLATNVKEFYYDRAYRTYVLLNNNQVYVCGRNCSVNVYQNETETYKWESLKRLEPNSGSPVTQCYVAYDVAYLQTLSGELYKSKSGYDLVKMEGIEGKVANVFMPEKDNINVWALLTVEGRLYLWGILNHYQLGDGTSWQSEVTIPKELPLEENIKAFSFINDGKACAAITVNDNLYTWGSLRTDAANSEIEKIPTLCMENVKCLEGCIAPICDKNSRKASHMEVIRKDSNNLYIKLLNNIHELVLEVPFKQREYVSYAIGADANYRTYWLANLLCLENGHIYEFDNEITSDEEIENLQRQYLFGDYNIIKNALESATSTDVSVFSVGLEDNIYEEELTSMFDVSAEVESVAEETAAQNVDFSGLLSNEIYNIYAVKTKDAEDCMADDNLLYIGQEISDENGRLETSFEMKEAYNSPEIFCVPYSRTDIADAEVIVGEITYDGYEHIPQVIVNYNNEMLEEGRDYEILLDVLPQEVGEYTLIVEGIGLFSGRQSVTYYVKEIGKTATPQASIVSGTVVEKGTAVELYTETEGAVVYYTLDGSTPTTESRLYQEAITINKDTVLYAIAVKNGHTNSDVAEFIYKVGVKPNVYIIMFESNGGSVVESQEINENMCADKPTDPVRDGYKFLGWYLNDVRYDFTTPVTDNLRLEAKWEWNESVPPSGDFGDVSEEDIPEGGIEAIPEGLWIAGVEKEGYSYTGSAIKPTVRVYDHKTLLKEKTDYTISYKNNKKAYTLAEGEKGYNSKQVPTITVKGKGNYAGTEKVTFKILPLDIRGNDFIIDNMTTSYNSKKVQKLLPTILWKNKKLKNKTDFKVTYPDANTEGAYKEADTYRIQVDGCGNYTGKKTITLDIIEAIPMAKVTVKNLKSQEYTGYPIEPDFTVQYGKNPLDEGKDYTVTYEKNTEVGTGYVVLTGKGDYSGQKRVAFKITGWKMTQAKVVSGLPAAVDYDGTAHTPECTLQITVKGATKTLNKNDDYMVSYDKNTQAGTAIVIFTGKGGYSGTLKKTFKINKFNVTKDENHLFTVEEKMTAVYAKGGSKPKPVVKYKDTVLKEGVDYTLSYKYNKAIHDGINPNKLPIITVKGKGSFMGSESVSFAIEGQDIGRLVMNVADKVYSAKKNGFKSTPKVYDLDGKLLKAGTDYVSAVEYMYKEETILADGTVRSAGDNVDSMDIVPEGTKILVTVSGNKNYSGKLTGEYEILKKGMDISKASITITPQEYTGKAIKLKKEDVKIKLNGAYLEPENFEIVDDSYKNHVKRGTASITVRGAGTYGGSKTVKFTIKAKKFEWWKEIAEAFFYRK